MIALVAFDALKGIQITTNSVPPRDLCSLVDTLFLISDQENSILEPREVSFLEKSKKRKFWFCSVTRGA